MYIHTLQNLKIVDLVSVYIRNFSPRIHLNYISGSWLHNVCFGTAVYYRLNYCPAFKRYWWKNCNSPEQNLQLITWRDTLERKIIKRPQKNRAKIINTSDFVGRFFFFTLQINLITRKLNDGYAGRIKGRIFQNIRYAFVCTYVCTYTNLSYIS